MPEPLISIGVAAALGADAIGRLAPAVERAGFASLWVNDTPGADSLAALAAAAKTTSTLTLATGVVPIDRRPPAEIAEAVRSTGVPPERLVLGIGSGGLRRGAVDAVEAAVGDLRGRAELADARIVVGALGPRMRALAASDADGVLLSWLTPDAAAAQASEQRAQAPRTHVTLYVRTALDPSAEPLRDEEARRYGGYPAYAANFARLGIDPLDTVLPPRDGRGFAEGAAAYAASVDELVLRAITSGGELDEYVRFVETAGALLAR